MENAANVLCLALAGIFEFYMVPRRPGGYLETFLESVALVPFNMGLIPHLPGPS